VTVLTAAVLLGAGLVPAASAADAPEIANAAVARKSATTVVFTAAINPHGQATDARLEFGATSGLGARSSAVAVPATSEPVLVTITLHAQPDSTYFWRFTATNPSGTAASEIQQVSTPKRARAQVLPKVQLSFAVETSRSGSVLGRLLGATTPSGLPRGTRITIRCRARCDGGRSFRITKVSKPGTIRRFTPPFPITRRSVVEIQARHDGYVGRIRRYRFKRSGPVLVAERVLDTCMTATAPRRPAACPR
jgi:hypothetical protein